MTTISAMAKGQREAIVEGLRAEFGAVVAARIIEAEAADFLWEARVKERYLGQHFDIGFPFDEDETELSRVAIVSSIAGSWHVAACLVDGEGMVVDLLWKKSFDAQDEAQAAFERAN